MPGSPKKRFPPLPAAWLRAAGGEQMGFGSGPGALNEGNGKQSSEQGVFQSVLCSWGFFLPC